MGRLLPIPFRPFLCIGRARPPARPPDLADCRQSVFGATSDEADTGKLPVFSYDVE